MRYAKRDWESLEVDGCRVFRVSGIKELTRIRASAYTWSKRHERTFECLTIPGGILFVVRYPDGSGTVPASQGRDLCQAVQSETRCKQWRLRVPTVPRLGRRYRLLTLPRALRWARPQTQPDTRRLRAPASTASR